MQKSDAVMLVVTAVVVVAVFIAGLVVVSNHQTGVDRDVMWQDDTITALSNGGYDGNLTVKEIKTHGDFGLGTYDKFNGEMIILDGFVYQALWDGSVRVADDSTTVPFATVTYFDNDQTVSLDDVESGSQIESQLDSVIDVDSFVAVRITGTFDLAVRSELPQEKPYRNIKEVFATDERCWTHQGVKGTIVAIYCPEFANGVNEVGWHFHFISENCNIGGHVLSITSGTGLVAEIDKCTSWTIFFPE